MKLEIRDLCVSYGGIRALKGVDLTVEEGQIVTLIGANGAGKSTTLRTIVGLVKAASGSIVYDGEELTGLTADQMSLEIRILSAVDTFDAMTSDRPYKKGMSTRSAIAELTTLSHQYDAEVVALLKAIVEDGTADQICRIGVEEKR